LTWAHSVATLINPLCIINIMAEKKEQQELLKKSEISLWLDTYDDIFSDFDPRPYSQRAISDDFLLEAKKASKDKESGIELKFLIPKSIRKEEQEGLIVRRLREHFKKHADELKKDYKSLVKRGMQFVVIGIILMFLATYILVRYHEGLVTGFLVVFLEPAGWFFFWEGLSQVIFESKKKKPDLKFYEKMAKCEITFWDY